MGTEYMIGLACAILTSLCSSILATQYKLLRMHDISSNVTLALRGLTVPVWLIGFIIFVYFFDKIPHTQTVYLLCCWAVLSVTSAWLKIFLMKYQNLSELNALLKGSSFLVLLASDIIFFDQELKITTIVASTVLIICGLIFSGERTVTKKKYEFNGSYFKILGIIVLITLIIAVQLIFYKKAALEQNDPLFFAFLASLIINPINFSLAPKKVISFLRKSDKSIMMSIFIIISMLIITEISQAKAYLELPLIMMNVAGVIPVVIFFVTDRLNGELAWSKKSIFAFICTIISLITIMMG